MHHLDCAVSFGDCDPAGIVFYPNVYRWFDRAFHDWLRGFGGHAALCGQFGAVGMGVMEASARFQRPLRDGDMLTVSLRVEEWGRKTLRLGYDVRVGEDTAVVGTEVRGLFKHGDKGMVAAELHALREVIGSDGRGR